jgi:deoxyribose-phosphate aldolase
VTADELKQGTIDTLLRIADRFGVPCVVLAVGIWMTREAAIAIHSTVVEPVVKSHVEFLDGAKETMARQAETLQELAHGQREIQQVLARPANTHGAN